METPRPEPTFLLNIGFMLTYHCTVACPHCIVEAGPNRNESMPLDNARKWIDEAAQYQNGTIQGCAFTGGEVFHDIDTLRELSDYAASAGLVVSVVTNAFWANTIEEALSVLRSLPSVRLICVSTDVFHQRAIPLDYAANAINAARQLGTGYSVAVCRDTEETQDFRAMMKKIEAFAEPEKIITSKTFPVGRAARQSFAKNLSFTSEPVHAACNMASSPVIFPDGRVVGCIGPAITVSGKHPLELGHLDTQPLSEILDMANRNIVLHAIRAWGPYKLVEWLTQTGCPVPLPEEFLKDCTCDVCFRILSDPELRPYLTALSRNSGLVEKTGYARAYYLGEDDMVVFKSCGKNL